MQSATALRRRVPSRPVLPPTDMPLDPPPCSSDLEGDTPRQGRSGTLFNRAALLAVWRNVLALLAIGALQPDATAAMRRVSRAQAMASMGAALLMAMLALSAQPGELWALVCAVVAGVGAGLAELLGQQRDTSLLGGILLLCSQLALLVWAFELDGPRIALLAFVPALAIFALRVAGRAVATWMTAALLALYCAWTLLHVRSLFLATLHWSRSDAVAFDAVVAAAGIFLTVLALLDMQRRRDTEPSLTPATADPSRLAYSRLLVELEADVERLSQALTGELGTPSGTSVAQPDESGLRRLEELIDFAAVRIDTLQRDHEARVRLEGAVGRLQRAVELLELGRTPRWPDPSGTAVDTVIARLRELHPDGTPARRFPGSPASPYASASGIRLNPDGSTPTGVLLPWRSEEGA
ncbi:MAG TPA: hypothetical protein VF120_02020 [Ktedonobacterales bacterium]